MNTDLHRWIFFGAQGWCTPSGHEDKGKGITSEVSAGLNFPPGSRVEIGIISDTHGLVRPEVYEAFEGVDLILHAGDIGSHDVILELEPIAPVKAVVGNVDTDLLHRYEEKIVFPLGNRAIHLQHILQDIPEENTFAESPISEIFIFGHSHKPMNRQVGNALYFNPGSAGPRRFKFPVTVGRITLDENSVKGKIIPLTP